MWHQSRTWPPPRAASLDPAFTAAHAGLADCQARLGYLSFLSPAAAFPLPRRHALLATERDSRLAESRASLGYVRFYFDWVWPDAETAFPRAVTLDPGWAATHQWCSIFLLVTGRAGEAAHEIELARERDPLSLAIKPRFRSGTLAGPSYQQVGRFDDALDEFSRVEESVPD